MKKLSFVILSMLLFGFISGSIGQEQFKFGVVDTNRVLQNYQKAIEADKVLKTAEKRLKEKLDNISEEIRTLREKKEKTELFIDKSQTANLEGEIQLKQMEYQQELERGRQALLEKNQELMTPIFKELEQLIIKTGKDENYDLIIDKQAALYFNEQYDMTEDLITLINAGVKEADVPEEDAPEPLPSPEVSE